MNVINGPKQIIFTKKKGGAVIKRVKHQGMCGWRETDVGDERVLVFGHKPNGQFYELESFEIIMIDVRRRQELCKRLDRFNSSARLTRSGFYCDDSLSFTQTA